MSTIVVVRKGDTACIAADSLTTFGDTRQPADYERWHDKIVQHQESYLGLVGSAAHQLVLQTLLSDAPKRFQFDDRAAIFKSSLHMHEVLKERYFLNPKDEEEDAYESSRIDALLINPRGMFGIYALREVFEYTRFWSIGSGSQFALGAMSAVYDRLDDAEAIARCGVESGATFDTGSALPMTLYSVRLKG